MNLTLRHFEIIEAVAEKRSIGRAASQLGLTQSAVTHALQALEEQVGTELFLRGRRGLEPTEAAKFFYREIKISVRALTPFLTISSGSSDLKRGR